MATTVNCGCNNGGSAAKYQDAKYGVGVRVASINKGKDLVCSVCGKVGGKIPQPKEAPAPKKK